MPDPPPSESASPPAQPPEQSQPEAATDTPVVPSKDAYGSDVGCMIVLGLMILLLPTLAFGTALLVAGISLCAVFAWLLERWSPRALHRRFDRWKIWLVYFLFLLAIVVTAAIIISIKAEGSWDEEYIKG